jgi:outer membrane lipoprotein-sorting protein
MYSLRFNPVVIPAIPRIKMKPLNFLCILLTSLLIAACSPDNSAQTKLFEQQRSALDKAKDVSNTVQQQSQEAQQNMEKQTQ